jgi:hypothetical protein
MPHQVILRVADSRPFSTHAFLKSDFRYKLLVFTGDVKSPVQRKKVEILAEGVASDNAMFQLYTIL